MWLIAAALLQLPLPPSAVHKSGEFQRPQLRESSGVAVSRTHHGVLWTHNDSGDGPFIYATDTAGKDRGAVRVTGAAAVDWEDIALGPCPRATGSCLYLADTGDNNEVRSSVFVYAVPEPAPPAAGDSVATTSPAAVLQLVYPGGPADVEAIYVARDATLYLVTKGRSRGVRLLRVRRDAWQRRGVVAAELVQQLPIEPQPRLGRLVTGAALSPDGAHVAVRTYTELYVFAIQPEGTLAPNPTSCLLGPLEPQGEAVDYLDASTLVLTSEAARGVPGIIHIVQCP
jgi:hypothetical protein